jgi:hypothetical protein
MEKSRLYNIGSEEGLTNGQHESLHTDWSLSIDNTLVICIIRQELLCLV